MDFFFTRTNILQSQLIYFAYVFLYSGDHVCLLRGCVCVGVDVWLYVAQQMIDNISVFLMLLHLICNNNFNYALTYVLNYNLIYV